MHSSIDVATISFEDLFEDELNFLPNDNEPRECVKDDFNSITSNEMVHKHSNLWEYNENYLNSCWKKLFVGRILIRKVIDLSFVPYKFRQKNSSYDFHVRNKCGGRKEYHSSKFIRYFHESRFVHDPFSHIVRVHFMLQIILHLIHLWVLSFTFRKRFFTVWTLSQPSVGGSLHYIIFLFCTASNFFILIFFSHFPLKLAVH